MFPSFVSLWINQGQSGFYENRRLWASKRRQEARKEATPHHAMCLEWPLSRGENMRKPTPLQLLHQMRNHKSKAAPRGLPGPSSLQAVCQRGNGGTARLLLQKHLSARSSAKD